jgi:hypothetical protein
VANHGVGPDAAFLDQEIELGRHALFHVEMRRLDEQAFDTDVQYTGDIITGIATPADPNVL